MTASPDPVDTHVGAMLRQLRGLRGLSQSELGKALGISFQQVQKYESGANRLSASKLYAAARRLEAPVTVFFDGLEPGRAIAPIARVSPEEIRICEQLRQLRPEGRRSMRNLLAALLDTDPAAGTGAAA